MAIRFFVLITAFAGLVGCATPTPTTQTQSVPDGVAQLAASGQSISTARLRASDNCYWYEHRNPLETTLLPLKTIDGRHICAG